LHTSPERFDHRIVKTITHGSQAETDAVSGDVGGESPGRELTLWSVIRVQNQAFRYRPGLCGHIQGRVHQTGVGLPVDGPPDCFACENVENNACEHASFSRWVLRDVGDPQSVRCCGREFPVDHVARGSNSDQIATPAPGRGKTMNSKVAHDRCHEFMVHDHTRFNA